MESRLNEVPIVEVNNAFDDNYFVGPPPGSTGAQNRPNPWQEPQPEVRGRGRPPKTARRPEPFQPQPPPDTTAPQLAGAASANNSDAPYTQPIPWTPSHPSLILSAPAYARRVPSAARKHSARRSHNAMTSSYPDELGNGAAQNVCDPPRIRPSQLDFERIAQATMTQPGILKATSAFRPTTSHASLPLPAAFNAGQLPSLAHLPRFAGAPNFTTFDNGVPQIQSLANFNHRQAAELARDLPGPVTSCSSRMPPAAHSSVPVSAASYPRNAAIALPGIPSTTPPSQMAPNTNAILPKAMSVKPAFLAFVDSIKKTLPGVDIDALLQQLNNNPRQLQVQVADNLDNDTQNQLKQNLQNIMAHYLNLNGIQQQQQQLQQLQQQQQHQQAIRGSFQQAQYYLVQQQQNNAPGVPRYPGPQNGFNNMAGQVPPPTRPPPPPSEDDMARQDLDADAGNDEEYHEVETYADYAPAKLTIGQPHPDPVVETSSLSTVEPPDINYKLKLPSRVIDDGLLSALQLETVIYASQQHCKLLPDNRTRRGFLIGDGAGVGKGRTIAGIIYENYLCGRKKAIWFSVSTDLKLDAERDLKDIGATRIPVFLLNKFQYGKRISEDHGIIFTTYSGLVSKSHSIRGQLGSRIGQLVSWVGPKFDGVIVFDECHKAKNISMGKDKKKKSKAAEFALDIQERLPNARIVYASATGASETRHLGYMTRLGIWGDGTPYKTFADFCEAIEKRGVGAMELVAVDLKMRGAYIARQLSFKTTSFRINIAALSEDFVALYDECVEMWSRAFRHFSEADTYMRCDKKRMRTMWASFWAAHQKFFKYLCIGAKVPTVVQIAQEALASDKCVVIGLQSTGEAKTLEALEDGIINEFVSTAKATFESLIDNHFPSPGGARPRYAASSDSDIPPRIQEEVASPNEMHELKSVSSSATVIATSSTSSSSTDDIFNANLLRFYHKDGKLEYEPRGNSTKKASAPTVAIANKRVSARSRKKADEEEEARRQQVAKNQKVLEELLEEKKKQNKSKSSRATRAKKRATQRGDKGRVKRLADSSDSETSNPLSSGSSDLFTFSSSSAQSADDNDGDETFSETELEQSSSGDSSTITEGDDDDDDFSPDELAVIESKPSIKKNVIDDDSDSDVQITAVKPRTRAYHDVIILSSDDEPTSDDDTQVDESAETNPLIVHGKRLTAMRDELYALIDSIGPKLPNNTLDDLIDRLGGPSKVAEMTGRKGRVLKDDEGLISYKQRNDVDALDTMNIAEKERFMKGEKFVAIISEAASSGISLQADKRVANKRRRVHITIELPWSADKAIQQFGRTHRSNQLSGPEYVFIISELAGEQRFASIVAKRLESLGALTHGDRRANNESRDLSQFNLDSKYSRHALENLRDVLKERRYIDNIKPTDYPEGQFIEDARRAFANVGLAKISSHNEFSIEPSAYQINQFLNRILGMRVRLQNAVFKLFTDHTERIVARIKIAGKYDAGILELNSESGKTVCAEPEAFHLRTRAGVVTCSLRQVQVERGNSWAEALKIYEERANTTDDRSGFYLTRARHIFLLIRVPDRAETFFQYKPNTGRQQKPLLYAVAVAGTSKINLQDAARVWTYIYDTTDTQCVHLCLFKSCKRMEARMKCDVGLRHRFYCILSGSVLTAWPYLERKLPDATSRIQIVRLRLDSNNHRVIGPVIPQDYVERVRKILKVGEREGVEF